MDKLRPYQRLLLRFFILGLPLDVAIPGSSVPVVCLVAAGV
jgi:hypothetical protein